MKTIQGKEIKGYSYADGIHWYWGDNHIIIGNGKYYSYASADKS